MSSSIDRQLALDVAALKPRYGRADFEIGVSNRAAISAVDAFVKAREPALAICGPTGAGKTHLAHILAAENGGAVLDASAVSDLSAEKGGLVVVDNAELFADPKQLLALVENSRAAGAKLALAGRGRPAAWAKGLEGLATRLEAMTRASLEEPDEALMRAVIGRRIIERQWRAREGVAAYAAPRLPRTFAAAAAFVDAVGAAAIAAGTPINLPLARKVLADLSERPAAE